MNSPAADQFLLCAGTLFEFQPGWRESAAADDFLSAQEPEITSWFRDFEKDLRNTSAYCERAMLVPELEDRLAAIFARAGLGKPVHRQPALCLTHDVDYTERTAQERIKSLLSGLKRPQRVPCDYLESLAALLRIDAQSGARATVFLAGIKPGFSRLMNPAAWLLDPSYNLASPQAAKLRSLLAEHECEIGLHGSYFSSGNRLVLQKEAEAVSAFSGKPVLSARQHWLRLSGGAQQSIAACGIKVDGTLGWNNAIGFRCGFSRPFPVRTAEGILKEVPLLAMDGAIFDSMRMSEEDAFKLLCSLLEELKKRGGCAALNWHERARAFGWDRLYERIVEKAASSGFRFLSMTEAANEYVTD